MAAEPELTDWNYFNYFTEVEEHFQRTRGSGLFLLSPLDWALIETWKNAGIPLEAVLRGIESAFEKWHAKKTKVRQINSLAYCAQAVQEEAEAMARGGALRKHEPAKAPFKLEELIKYLRRQRRRASAEGSCLPAQSRLAWRGLPQKQTRTMET